MISATVFGQDNQRAILLEQYDRGSCIMHTRNINIYIFFVADCISFGNLELRYCPTSEMMAENFAKPLQASMFKSFYNLIMNPQPQFECFKPNVLMTPDVCMDHRILLGS